MIFWDWLRRCRKTRCRRFRLGKNLYARRGGRSRSVEPLEVRNLLTASVTTDLADYVPGATAHVYAAGFTPGETLQFLVLHSDGTPNTGNGHLPWSVTDGSAADLDGISDGAVHTTWYVDPDDSLNSTFLITAQGLDSNLTASATFTDAFSTNYQHFANKSPV